MSRWYVEVNNCCVIVEARTEKQAIERAVYGFVSVGEVRKATKEDLAWHNVVSGMLQPEKRAVKR